jgi:hypothetical protein
VRNIVILPLPPPPLSLSLPPHFASALRVHTRSDSSLKRDTFIT